MKLLSSKDMATLLNVPVRTTYQLVKTAGFPAPVIDISQRMRRWTLESVEKWVNKQQALNSR